MNGKDESTKDPKIVVKSIKSIRIKKLRNDVEPDYGAIRERLEDLLKESPKEKPEDEK